MSRTEEFLTLFNELEQHLRDSTDSQRNVPFGGLVDLAAKRNAAIRHFGRELREWSDLRNAVVHEHPKGRVIAEVTAEALEELQAMVARVTAPPNVFPLYQRDVRVFIETDPLVEAVEDLWREGYSQVIVRQNASMTLLSYAGITCWMGEAIDGTVTELANATIGSALKFEEEGGIAFLARSATIYDARELFQQFPERRKQRLRVIVIAENGKATEAPLGLITASDLVEAEA